MHTVLRWFYDTFVFTQYAFNPADSYPLTVEAINATYNTLVGGVDIQILAANLVADRSMVSFLSTMTVNVSALQKAGISNISCGSSLNVISTARLANIIQG